MDSYLKSSAVNRHHYALVHKVENATSVQEADKAIWDELDRIKAEFTHGQTTTRDDLVILMYCHTAAVTRPVAFADLEFALSPAVNLAATGRNVKDRLTFCAQFMPPTHPLQLMLVNTLRKEIESDEIARIVLAIDFIIACPSQFIGPAVAGRLEVLLGNKSQNLRHRALLALRALSTPDPNSEDPSDTESYLAHHAPTVMRRLNRAAREDRVRSDEIGAIGALLLGARDLLETGVLGSKEVIPAIAALLEKAVLATKHDRSKPVKLVTPLLATLHTAVRVRDGSGVDESMLADLAKLAARVVYVFADRPASPQVLQAFRLLGVLPVRTVHASLQNAQSRTPDPSRSPGPSQSPRPSNPSQSPRTGRTRKSNVTKRHPVLILRPLITSRDPTERWAGLSCLECLDVRLWAGVPLKRERDDESKLSVSGVEQAEDLIPPVLDEWEVGAIMRGLSDADGTLRKLTMRVLHKVDPQLVHAFFEQLITPPPAADSTNSQPKSTEALEVLAFLYDDNGAEFAGGVGKVLDATARREEKGKGKDNGSEEARKAAVDQKLVEATVLVLDESNQKFRSGFADAMLERLEQQIQAHDDGYGPGSLISPISHGAAGSSSPGATTPKPDSKQADPTTVLLFATTAVEVSSDPRRAVEVLLSMLPGRGAGIQEVLILAALRLVPRLAQPKDVASAKARVEEFGKTASLSRHMRRRCEMFIQFIQDMEVLERLVDETRSKSLPEFLQALLSQKPPPPPTPKGALTTPPETSNRASPVQTKAQTISPEFSTISLAHSPALRYDAYAAPQPAPRRNRPKLQSPFRGESLDTSTSGDSPFVSGNMDESAGSGKGKHNVSHLQLDVTGSSGANPNADLITLSALESPFRAETDFRTLSLDESDLSYNRASDPETPLSPRFHTAVMTSPRLGEGGDLSPSDADAIWTSFDSVEGAATSSLGKQTLRGWCERTPESLGNALRGLGVGFVTQKVGLETAHEKEVFAFIPAPADSPDTEVARAVVRLKPADDGSCLWMLRCVEFELRVKIRKALDGDLA